jgi:hypothetical protein
MTVHAYGVGELGVVVGDEGEGRGRGRGRGGRGGGGEGQGDEWIQRPDGLDDAVWEGIVGGGKKYLLEVNPHYADASTSDKLNRIDARWIDVQTGLFIDITTVHPVPRPPKSILSSLTSFFSSKLGKGSPAHSKQYEEPEDMYTKDTHLYSTSSLFPLRSARFEGAAVSVPYAYEQLLIEEYGPRALTETWFNGFRFDRQRKEWVVAPPSPVHGFEQGGRGKGAVTGKVGSLLVHEDEGARSEMDNKGKGGYETRPGRVGDVHVVPGSG